MYSLAAVRTPRAFLQSRLTPEMEEQLMFVMKSVSYLCYLRLVEKG